MEFDLGFCIQALAASRMNEPVLSRQSHPSVRFAQFYISFFGFNWPIQQLASGVYYRP
jgi:hypothetical protein